MNIGNYSVPDKLNPLSKAIEKLKKIYDKYGKNIIPRTLSNDAIAQLLDYSGSNNSSFQRTIRTLRDYGFLEGKTDLKVTERGEKVLYGRSDDKNQAILEAFLSIPLWNKLYENFGKSIPSNDFWLDLQQITGCTPKEGQELEKTIREQYVKDTNIINVSKISDAKKMEPTLFQTAREREAKSEVPQYNNTDEEIMALLTRKRAYSVIEAYLKFMQEESNKHQSESEKL
jgi:hypothetical protein